MEQIDPLINDYIQNRKFEGTKILICTPCYGGILYEGFTHGMCDLHVLFNRLGIQFEFHTISNESLVTRARNSLVARFLGKSDCTHLMFIDADITFNPRSILRLLAFDKEVVGGSYPKKTVNWSRAKRTMLNNPDIDHEDLLSRSLDYVVNIVAEENKGQREVPIDNGFVKVQNIGTGFLLIKRHVFDTLRKAYPNDIYQNDISGYDSPETKNNFWLFFDTMVHPDTRRYLSEDYAFCHKWTMTGGDVWMDIASPLIHTGTFNFKGNVYHYLKDNIRASSAPESQPSNNIQDIITSGTPAERLKSKLEQQQQSRQPQNNNTETLTKSQKKRMKRKQKTQII